MKISFLGAAGTVTGSKTLLEINGLRILVDCGLFQGVKTLRELNWQPLPVEAQSIDYVLLTHGHLDHCGWLPCLVDHGFSGKIYCTRPTKEVSKLILLDSAKIQEEEAQYANSQKYSKHNPALPLYDLAKAERTFPHFHVIEPSVDILLAPDISIRFFPSGHIIGACSIELRAEGKTMVFSGDIGRDEDVLMHAPVKPAQADYIFLESTYGDRLHPKTDCGFELEIYINNAFEEGGTVIIPGFAIERIQSVMYELWQLKRQDKIPNIPYIVDSPMGISVLDIFNGNPEWHKLNAIDCKEMCDMFRMISDYSETIDAIFDDTPKVVLAASGMLTGGRVLSYLERYLSFPQTSVIITGYQAEGTRGRKLLEGASEIKIHGHYYPVKAKVLEIQGLSAHADQTGLVNWLSGLTSKPKQIFLVHGENQAADTLRVKIRERFGYDCHVPLLGSQVEI